MSLTSMRLLYRLTNYLVGHHSMSLEKNVHYTLLVIAYAKPIKPNDKVKFLLYRYIRGYVNYCERIKKGFECFGELSIAPLSSSCAYDCRLFGLYLYKCAKRTLFFIAYLHKERRRLRQRHRKRYG